MSSANRSAVPGLAFASAIGLVLALVLSGGSAMAAPRPHARHATSTAGLHPHGTVPAAGKSGTVAPNVVPATDQGAGYWMYPTAANGLASVSATFTMPTTFKCVKSTDNEWLLPGIWVFSSGTLSEQVDVNFNCNTGTKLQEGIVCLVNTGCNTSLAVSPGDKLIASLAYTPTATVTTLKNVTTQTSVQEVGGVVTTDDIVLVGDVGPDWFGPRKVPKFSNLHFSAVQLNGQYLVDGPFPTRYNLKTDTRVQISTTNISSDGAQFTTIYKHT